ncbi:hypothetical protein PMIN06_012677 [Paraphaeosphaeria minitans]
MQSVANFPFQIPSKPDLEVYRAKARAESQATYFHLIPSHPLSRHAAMRITLKGLMRANNTDSFLESVTKKPKRDASRNKSNPFRPTAKAHGARTVSFLDTASRQSTMP